MGRCYYCGAEIEQRVYRSSLCPVCGKELKTCINCEFYSPGSHWDCRETIPEPVRDKDRANFCDYFKLSSSSKPDGGNKKSDTSRQAFKDLFGE